MFEPLQKLSNKERERKMEGRRGGGGAILGFKRVSHLESSRRFEP